MKTAVFIDGGHLRVLVRNTDHTYNPDYIDTVARACIEKNESIFRILYYDCPPFRGNARLPVSGKLKTFARSGQWLEELSAKPSFAVRRGVLKFRGFEPKKIPISKRDLSDDDFKPRFEQKGVDMRLGLDIATYATNRILDRIVLITGDTDCLPAIKLARIAGLQVVIVEFPGQNLSRELICNSDFHRIVKWPSEAQIE